MSRLYDPSTTYMYYRSRRDLYRGDIPTSVENSQRSHRLKHSGIVPRCTPIFLLKRYSRLAFVTSCTVGWPIFLWAARLSSFMRQPFESFEQYGYSTINRVDKWNHTKYWRVIFTRLLYFVGYSCPEVALRERSQISETVGGKLQSEKDWVSGWNWCSHLQRN